jgi:L-alanine-DL-glutamate epimerase-like enolase superfamily enzyme
VRVVSVEVSPLSVPLREPFVIATGRMDGTRAALVRVVAEAGGCEVVGLGEAAALPPVTAEDQPELCAELARAGAALAGATLDEVGAVGARLDALLGGRPVARAGLESALLDALARAQGRPVHAVLGSSEPPAPLVTDVTVPIVEPAHAAELARRWSARGFRCFKVKVGRDPAADGRALEALAGAVPGARVRLDANEGLSARDALALLERALDAGLAVELFEQPCRRDDLAGLREVAAHAPVPVVADESARSLADVEAIAAAGAAAGVNLKLAKHGGLVAAVEIGRRARALGLRLMAGAMVETRLGLTAMGHVVAALGGVDWVDLDTALLLAADPFAGGLEGDGPELRLASGPGLAIRVR